MEPDPAAPPLAPSVAAAQAFAIAVASTLHPSQIARVALAIDFIAPPGFVAPKDVVGMLGSGNHELAVRLFASKGWGDRGDVDEMARLQGGFNTDTTALAALDDLGRTLDEFKGLGGCLPTVSPATRDVALLRIASIQLEMKELRKRATERDVVPGHDPAVAAAAAAVASAAAAAALHAPPHMHHPLPPQGKPLTPAGLRKKNRATGLLLTPG